SAASNRPPYLRAARYRATRPSRKGVAASPTPPGSAAALPLRGQAASAPVPLAASHPRKRRRSISIERIETYPYAKGRRHVLIDHAFGVLEQQACQGQLAIIVATATPLLRVALHG